MVTNCHHCRNATLDDNQSTHIQYYIYMIRCHCTSNRLCWDIIQWQWQIGNLIRLFIRTTNPKLCSFCLFRSFWYLFWLKSNKIIIIIVVVAVVEENIHGTKQILKLAIHMQMIPLNQVFDDSWTLNETSLLVDLMRRDTWYLDLNCLARKLNFSVYRYYIFIYVVCYKRSPWARSKKVVHLASNLKGDIV